MMLKLTEIIEGNKDIYYLRQLLAHKLIERGYEPCRYYRWTLAGALIEEYFANIQDAIPLQDLIGGKKTSLEVFNHLWNYVAYESGLRP